jgi:hypothetical protein
VAKEGDIIRTPTYIARVLLKNGVLGVMVKGEIPPYNSEWKVLSDEVFEVVDQV